MPTDLCLSVLKYSSGNGTRTDGTIPWSHLVASNLFTIIKGSDVFMTDGKLNMKIVQGTKVLDSIEVSTYIDAANDAKRIAEADGKPVNVEHLPISVVTRDAALALRYYPKKDEPRRLQLRMRNSAECKQILEAFVRRGIVSQVQGSATRHAKASRPNTATSQEQPQNMQTISLHDSSHQPVTSRPALLHTETLNAGTLSGLTTDLGRPTLRRGEFVPDMAPTGSHVFSEASAAIPASSQSMSPMYRSYTTPAQPSQTTISDGEPHLVTTQSERPMSSSILPTIQAIRDATTEPRSSPDLTFEIPPPTLRVPLSSEYWSSNAAPPSSDGPVLRSDLERPSTSASMIWPYDNPSLKRPQSDRSDRSGSRPSSSALSMPPLPKPKLIKESIRDASGMLSTSATTEAATSRPVTASPLKRRIADMEPPATRPQTASSVTFANPAASRTLGPQAGERLQAQTSALSAPAKRRASPMNELLYEKKPLAERSTNASVPRMSSLLDAPYEEITPPTSSAGTVLPTKSISQGGDSISNHGPLPATAPGVRDSSLEEYAAQNQQDRQTALDDFMVAHLESPAFVTLCEDVENCWRRIALGL